MESLQKLYEECINELETIGINYDFNKVDINISKRNNKRYGCCKPDDPDKTSKYIEKIRGRRYIKYGKYNKYHIEISPWVMELDDKIIKNTIIHEIIHCFPGCDNHGSEFKKYAKFINEKLDYNISRLGNKRDDYNKSNLQFVDEVVYKYMIKCQKCGQIFYRKRCDKKFTKKYRCGECKRKI